MIAHQWWWEFRYPDLGIVTANELHVPLSDPHSPTPTFLDLESADVAHSFWVPRLAGKTDVIPNKKNSMWIDPQVAGTYLGQCGEYCGTEHAMMLLRVIVEPRADFDAVGVRTEAAAGRRRERGARPHRLRIHRLRQLPHHQRDRGRRPLRSRPHPLMARETIGSGVAMNTPAHLKIWVSDPNVMKPGALMPAMNLDDKDLDDLVSYLNTLH